MIFATMFGTLAELDATLLVWIHSHLHNEVLDWLMPVFREKWTWLPLYIFLIAFMLLNFGKRGGLWILFFVFAIICADTISTRVLKYQVKRVRPCHTEQVAERLEILVSCGGTYGFVSSHAANHFAMAAFIFFTLGRAVRRVRWPVMIWAGLVAFAQVYVGVHYPLDILGGAVLGLSLGWLLAWYYSHRLAHWAIPASNLN
jgi:undecaprenyl-diphosphatase